MKENIQIFILASEKANAFKRANQELQGSSADRENYPTTITDGSIIIKANENEFPDERSCAGGKEKRNKKKNDDDDDDDDDDEHRKKFDAKMTTPFGATTQHSQIKNDHHQQGTSSSSISQFSALTLRMAFKFSRRPNGLALKQNHQHHQQQPERPMNGERKGSHGNLSSVSASATMASSEGNIFSSEILLSHSRRSVSCNCCCCANNCSQQLLSTNAISNNGMTTSSQRQRTQMGPGPANQLTGRSNITRRAAAATAARQCRWQKATPRMPIPVPPPIVPLHKQLACGLHDSVPVCDGVYENSSSADDSRKLTFRLEGARDDKCKFNPNGDLNDDDDDSHHNPLRNDLIWPVKDGAPSPGDAASIKSDIGADGDGSAGRGGAKMGHVYEGNWIELSHDDPSCLSAQSSTRLVSSSQCAFSNHDCRYLRGDVFRLHEAKLSQCKFNGGDGQNSFPRVPKDGSKSAVSRSKGFSPKPSALATSAMMVASSDHGSVPVRDSDVSSVAEITNAAICVRERQNENVDDDEAGKFQNGQLGRIIASEEKYGQFVNIGRCCSGVEKASDDRIPSPSVDIKFQIRQGSCDDTSTLPQATNAQSTHAAMAQLADELQIVANEHHEQRSSLSAIYDLPESGGAREFVRVQLSSGKRTVTARRLPLRPARRPSMPPPPPPPQQQPQQRKRSAAGAHYTPNAARIGMNSGCVAANFSAGRAPISTFNVSSTVKSGEPSKTDIIKCNNPNDCDQEQQTLTCKKLFKNTNKPVVDESPRHCEGKLFPVKEETEEEEEDKSSFVVARDGTKELTRTNQSKQQQQQQRPTSKVVRFNCELKTNSSSLSAGSKRAVYVTDKVNEAKSCKILYGASIESPHSLHPGGEQKIPSFNEPPSRCDNKLIKVSGIERVKRRTSCDKESGHKQVISSEKESDEKQTNQAFRLQNLENTLNMGSSHSNSAAAAVSETQQHITAARDNMEPGKKKAMSAATLTKARSHEETNHSKKVPTCTVETLASHNSNSNQSTTKTTTTTTTTNEAAAPQIIKSISNMTNKLVGEAKIVTGALKDAGQQQQINVDGGSGKQHVPSALQMCIKGVVKPAHKNSSHQQTSTSSAFNRKPAHQQHGRYLDRPFRGFEDSLERRRKSLQDGDVFIYPRLYKDLNECRKCLRDNRICNCIEMELSSDGSSSMEKVASTNDLEAPSELLAPNSNSSHLPQINININNKDGSNKEHRFTEQSSSTSHTAAIIDRDDAARRRAGVCDDDNGEYKQLVYQISVTTDEAPKLIMPASLTSSININMAIDNLTAKDENNNFIIEEPSNRISTQVSEQKSGCAQPKKFNSSCGGNEASNALISLQEPSNSEPIIGSRDGLLEDFEAAAAAVVSTATAPEQQASSVRPASNCDAEAATANCSCVDDRLKSPDCTDSSLLLFCEVCDNSLVTAARQTSSDVRVKWSPSAKVTTIAIGSPTKRHWQEQQKETADANNNNHGSMAAKQEQQQVHTSIVSIRTRRRNMTSTKLGTRRAIYEEQDKLRENEPDDQRTNEPIDDDPNNEKITATTSLVTLNTHGTVVARSTSPIVSERQLLLSEPISVRDSLGRPTCHDSGLDRGALDYSPILSSVRDYIKNMNTELQVQTSSMASPCLTTATVDNLLAGCEGGIGSGSYLSGSSAAGVRKALNAADLVVASPSTIPHSLASSASQETRPIQVVTSTATGIVQTTFTTALPATSIKAHGPGTSSGADRLDSLPKKSIFDGASKDEILEYLEDARERVPEILMAADDVMVINENEVIVVNQLEPGSPATPISIVETNEIIGGGGVVVVNDTGGCSETGQNIHHHSMTHPDQLRQHLEQMYQTSQLAAAAAEAQPETRTDSPESITFDEETKDIVAATTELTLAIDLCRSPDLLRSADVSELNKYSTETGIDSPDSRLLLDKDQEGSEVDSSERDKLRANNNETSQQQQQPLPTTNRTRHSENMATACGLLGFAGPIYAGRRNSASGSVSQLLSSSSGREHAMQILALQKRYTNRNSLSSPSSTSPSSSSSSNQTSGNCSAATSFYASSSLSCSSPLLNMNGTFTSTSNSPAFNQSSALPSSVLPLPQLPPAPSISESSQPMAMNLMHKFDGLDLTNIHSQSSINRPTLDMADSTSKELLLTSPDVIGPQTITSTSLFAINKPHHVDRYDSGIGSEPVVGATANRLRSMTISSEQATPSVFAAAAERQQMILNGKPAQNIRTNSETGHLNHQSNTINRCDGVSSNSSAAKLGRIDESASSFVREPAIDELIQPLTYTVKTGCGNGTSGSTATITTSNARFSPKPSKQNNNGLGLGSTRGVHGHYNTLSRLNNYFMNRHPFSSCSSDSTCEFQCLDCDQFIDVDQATIMNKTNELRLLRATDSRGRLDCSNVGSEGREMTAEQLDRAYVAAMNGLPLCKMCEKKRIERKEIISEFVETELKYGRDLKIIHDEFFRPMQIAGLLTKDQISGVFLNLEELIMTHCKFANRLETAIREAHSIGDTDFNTVNIGGLFVESSEMLNTFELYCIRQGAAACLLARLAKERELLRIFLRVSQMENTLLRRMNLAAFLMVPVQRVTKYPLLLNRLYKVTAYHHKDREALRDAQLRVELHLEHINQQTKGIGASNKIWRRISSLSAPISNRRGLMNAEDIGYIKLRRTAMDMLKWDRDETQFIHSGKIHFAPLAEYLTRQNKKPLRYVPAHALLIVSGRPNWKYRPDLVKANLDSKLMTPTPAGNGIREAALLLFREKSGRFVPCREPLLLSNCVLSADCSQFNNECQPTNQTNIMRPINQQQQQQQQSQHMMNGTPQQQQHNSSTGSRKSCSSTGSDTVPSVIKTSDSLHSSKSESGKRRVELSGVGGGSQSGSIDSNRSSSPKEHQSDSRTGSLGGDIALISSLRNLIDDTGGAQISGGGSPPEITAAAAGHGSRSYSLASALPRTNLATTTSSAINVSKPIISAASSNLTILNQLMTKVNNYHNRQSTNGNHCKQTASTSISSDQSTKNRPLSPSTSSDTSATPQSSNSLATDHHSIQQQQQGHDNCNGARPATGGSNSSQASNSNGLSSGRATNTANGQAASSSSQDSGQLPSYNNYHYFHYNHHQPYGDYEESFEIHERLGKESMLLRADTPLKTRYWLQMLRYHAKDLGQWRSRRNGLPNIMMMRHE